MDVTEDSAIYNPFKYKVYLQWNPLNTVTNGSKEFGCINGVAGLTRIFLQENVPQFLPGSQKQWPL